MINLKKNRTEEKKKVTVIITPNYVIKTTTFNPFKITEITVHDEHQFLLAEEVIDEFPNSLSITYIINDISELFLVF